MNKKMRLLILSILMLNLATITYGIQLGDFENPSDPNHDGWIVVDDPNSTTDPNVSVSYSTTGATLGSNSLRIDADPNYQLALEYSLIDQGLIDEFRNNLKVSLDITRLTSEWTDQGSSWCELFVAVQAGSSVEGSIWDFWQQLDTEADWEPANGDDPMSFTYDYSTTINQIDFDNLEYLNFVLCPNWGGYDPGGTYYIDNIQMFGGGPAYDPVPANNAREVLSETTLSWTPGVYADKHDLYFGTNFNDVNDANRTNPLGVLISQDRSYNNNTYDPPGFLTSGKTHYWRVDEVNGPDIWPGEVWAFTTVYPGVGVVIGDWEDTMDGWVPGGGNPTLSYSTTGATLNEKSLKIEVQNGWFWIITLALSPEQLEDLKDNDILSLDVTWVASEWEGSTWSGVQQISINAEGIGWNQMSATGDTSNPDAPGDWNPTEFGEIDTRTITWNYSGIDVGSIPEGGWCFMQFSTGHDAPGTYYFDNARFLNSKLASDPSPNNRAEDVKREPTLSWKPGSNAATHDVYFGANYNNVMDANRVNQLGVLAIQDQAYDVNTYEPGILEFDTVYYWRIDEVNGTDIWKGAVWAFIIGKYLVIDDFEDYNDFTNLIFRTWKDGYGEPSQGIPGNGTGSIVGWSGSPVAEREIVQSGLQSMPLFYDNSVLPFYSEAIRTWETPQDWTEQGSAAMAIWFRGYRPYVGSLSRDAATNTYTLNAAGNDIWDNWDARKQEYYDQFHFAYKQLSGEGSIIAKIENLTYTSGWAKAGVMIRETLNANSPHAMVVITPGNGVAFQFRVDTGGTSTNINQEDINAPHWVKLTRSANTFTAQHSADGQNWVDVQGDLSSMIDIPMSVNTYVGLALTAQNPFATCEAVFSNVSTNGTVSPTGPFTQSQDIGIRSNAADKLYVILEDDDGHSKLIEHSEPNGTQHTTWREWNIDMREFINAGVNTAAVTKMTLGIGNKAAPSATGDGLMYIDDIRLYLPRCVPSELQPIGDLNDDCVVDKSDLVLFAAEWLSPAPDAADLDDDGDVDFVDYVELASVWLEELLWPQL